MEKLTKSSAPKRYNGGEMYVTYTLRKGIMPRKENVPMAEHPFFKHKHIFNSEGLRIPTKDVIIDTGAYGYKVYILYKNRPKSFFVGMYIRDIFKESILPKNEKSSICYFDMEGYYRAEEIPFGDRRTTISDFNTSIKNTLSIKTLFSFNHSKNRFLHYLYPVGLNLTSSDVNGYIVNLDNGKGVAITPEHIQDVIPSFICINSLSVYKARKTLGSDNLAITVYGTTTSDNILPITKSRHDLILKLPFEEQIKVVSNRVNELINIDYVKDVINIENSFIEVKNGDNFTFKEDCNIVYEYKDGELSDFYYMAKNTERWYDLDLKIHIFPKVVSQTAFVKCPYGKDIEDGDFTLHGAVNGGYGLSVKKDKMFKKLDNGILTPITRNPAFKLNRDNVSRYDFKNININSLSLTPKDKDNVDILHFLEFVEVRFNNIWLMEGVDFSVNINTIKIINPDIVKSNNSVTIFTHGNSLHVDPAVGKVGIIGETTLKDLDLTDEDILIIDGMKVNYGSIKDKVFKDGTLYSLKDRSQRSKIPYKNFEVDNLFNPDAFGLIKWLSNKSTRQLKNMDVNNLIRYKDSCLTRSKIYTADNIPNKKILANPFEENITMDKKAKELLIELLEYSKIKNIDIDHNITVIN